MTGRSVPEWIGATPDTAIPPRVRLRVFEAHGGMCHISGRRIRAGEAWECDHVVALCNDGPNAESNLAPALTSAHRAKTADDVAEKSKVARTRAKHLGVKAKGRGFGPQCRKMDGSVGLTKAAQRHASYARDQLEREF